MTRDEQRRFNRRRKAQRRYERSARYRAMVRAEDERDGVLHFVMRGDLPQVDGSTWKPAIIDDVAYGDFEGWKP